MPMALPDHLRLNLGSSRMHGKAPHKPILLLTVLKAFDDGLIVENRIAPSAELVNLFHGYWAALVPQGHFQRRFFLPFYHLKNERSGLWKLHTLPGFERSISRSNSINSLGSLIAFEAHAKLRADVYQRWLDAESRAIDRQLLMAAYFPDLELPAELPDHLRDLEQRIATNSPTIVGVQQQGTQEEEEEEVVLRSAAFKRKVPELYGYRCAITGLQVRSTRGPSLIDACHIVPWADSFDDTISNGIALCPNMHRAFDRGLISIAVDHTVLVARDLQETESIYAIRPFAGKPLLLPGDVRYRPAPEKLARHRERFGY
ncbi:MAG: HNH endonuclease [Flavobacteriales bacterium]|nr:HNH endonuclease [Flavobacteriales bacterium]